MIKIDDLYYNAHVSVAKININGQFQNVIVLKTEGNCKFENIRLIKTPQTIYKIGDILKIFKEDNIYWLELLDKSENLDDEKIHELETKNNLLVEDLNKAKEDLDRSKKSASASMMALIEINGRLNRLEKEVEK